MQENYRRKIMLVMVKKKMMRLSSQCLKSMPLHIPLSAFIIPFILIMVLAVNALKPHVKNVKKHQIPLNLRCFVSNFFQCSYKTLGKILILELYAIATRCINSCYKLSMFSGGIKSVYCLLDCYEKHVEEH